MYVIKQQKNVREEEIKLNLKKCWMQLKENEVCKDCLVNKFLIRVTFNVLRETFPHVVWQTIASKKQ